MKRVGVVVVLIAVVAGLVLWRCQARDGAKRGAPAAQATRGTGAAGAATAKREDPRKLARASIAGTVTDQATKLPIAGAQVCADGWSHDVAGEVFRDPTCVVTDANGAYLIANLLSANYMVSAVAKSYRPAGYEQPNKKHKQSFLLAPGEAKQGIDLALRGGGVEITGTVSDITGGPVANARVRASAGRWGGGTQGPPVETDAQGKYSLWSRPGGVRVTAGADGYAEASEMGDAPGTVDLLLTPESSLTGTVVDAKTGAPIEGARVSVQTSMFGWDRQSERSDAQGKFRVHGLTPGRYVAEATTESGYGRTEGSTLVGLGQHVDDVIVRVHPALRVQGKVMIKGEPPTVCEDGFAYFRDEANNRWVSGRTDPDGTITADGVVPGKYTVEAGCRGYASTKEKLDPLELKDKDMLGLVWEVEAGATIKGRVLSKRGEPIADVDITARTTGGGLRDQQRWAIAQSKPDGTYELDGLRAATYRIEPQAKRQVTPRDGFTVTAPPGKIVEKDLILDDGGTIEGVVVDEQGKSVEGVKVNASSIENDWNWRWDSGDKSDLAGKFTIEGLRPGEYRVIASKGWFETLRKPGTTDDEQHPGEKAVVRVAETTRVKLVIEAQSGTIKGTVVDADGKPVGDAYLSAARESDAAGAQQSNVSATRDWDWGEEKPTLTNVDGTFTISRLSPGKYTVRAYRKGGGEAVQEHVAVGQATRLQIKPTGSIAGLAKRDGGPPDEITVTLADLKTGFNRDERFYKTGGKFTIHDLPQGHFHVTVSTDGGSKKIELDLAEGETKTGVELTLDSLVTITGRVVEMGTQKPVPGMRVFAQAATGGGFSFSWGPDADNDNISDEAGKFTVKRVPRGQISVQGMPKERKTSDYSWFRTLRTLEGTQTTVDIGDVSVIKRRVKEGEKSGELGLNFKDQPPDTPPDQQKFEVSFIDPKGPAVTSGIKVGDVLTSVDGIDVTGGNAMNAWTLMNAPPGTKLSLGLARNATVTIVLAAP